MKSTEQRKGNEKGMMKNAKRRRSKAGSKGV